MIVKTKLSIKATKSTRPFPLGYIDRQIICIGSMALGVDGSGGRISQEQAIDLLIEAVKSGAAKITIEFRDVSIELKEE